MWEGTPPEEWKGLTPPDTASAPELLLLNRLLIQKLGGGAGV